MKYSYKYYEALLRKQVFYYRQKYCYKFFFVHINKTGGSSIEDVLHLPLQHNTAKDFITKYGYSFWNKKFTFTIVRNPWDRVVSQYHYRIETNQNQMRTNNINFDDWVYYTYEKQDPKYINDPKYFIPQLQWITDDTGKILVDYICKFENLSNDFKYVQNILNMKGELPHLKKTDRGKYQDYYNHRTKSIVEKWYQKDINRLNYTYNI